MSWLWFQESCISFSILQFGPGSGFPYLCIFSRVPTIRFPIVGIWLTIVYCCGVSRFLLQDFWFGVLIFHFLTEGGSIYFQNLSVFISATRSRQSCFGVGPTSEKCLIIVSRSGNRPGLARPLYPAFCPSKLWFLTTVIGFLIRIVSIWLSISRSRRCFEHKLRALGERPLVARGSATLSIEPSRPPAVTMTQLCPHICFR
jgi:hypothetical protein